MSLFRTKAVAPKLEATDQERVDGYTATFTGPSGAFVLEDLFYFTKMYTTVFGEADFDPIRAAHFDGMQTVVKRILNLSGRTFKP
jgi:hypothetical protein